MKKGIVIILVFIVIYLFVTNSSDSKFIIPAESIRLRVVPNSNSNYDQNIKEKVSVQLQHSMSNLLKDTRDVNEARSIIGGNLNYIDVKIGDLLRKENYNLGYNLNFAIIFFMKRNIKGLFILKVTMSP